jgi:hypothetical protein
MGSKRQQQRSENAAHQRRHVGRAERAPGLAVLGHREAVQHGRRRGRRTWHAEQHRGDRIARSRPRQPSPSSSAKAEYGSMLNVNGSSMAMPAMPPMPGTMPSTRPIRHPATSSISRCGSIRTTNALPAAEAMNAASPAIASMAYSSAETALLARRRRAAAALMCRAQLYGKVSISRSRGRVLEILSGLTFRPAREGLSGLHRCQRRRLRIYLLFIRLPIAETKTVAVRNTMQHRRWFCGEYVHRIQ